MSAPVTSPGPSLGAFGRRFPAERRICWECRGDFIARWPDEVFCRLSCGHTWRARLQLQARRRRATAKEVRA